MNLNNEMLGLYLNFKIMINNTHDIFDYSKSDEINNINTFIEKSIYLVLTKDNEIITINEHSEIQTEKDFEQILFGVKKDEEKNTFILINPMPGINILPTENNVNYLNHKLWYVINSEPAKESYNINEDYYLNENDIIKLGNLKYVIKKINIDYHKNEHNTKEYKYNYNIKSINEEIDSIFDFYPLCNNYKNCNFYDSIKARLCECKELVEINCIKEWIKNIIQIKENKKVRSYYIKQLICENCQKTFPIRFKVKNEDKKYELINIEEFEKEYIILESFYRKVKGEEKLKSIHLISLSNGDIHIGRRADNDVIEDDNGISKEHAIISFKKENGKLLLKNKGRSGTLVLIKNSIEINKNKIHLQIGKIFIEVCLMKKKDFEVIKNDKTKYPLPDKKNIY